MPDSKPRPTGASYIPTLDGWRAVAILAVLVCHGLDQRQHPFAEPLGSAGVLLFFSISGFLITRRMLDEESQTGAVSLRKFYLRRAFRILPPALFYLAAITFLGLMGVFPFSAEPILKALFFVRNYAYFDFAMPATWYSAHFWSLSVEEHFYLIWPFLCAGGVQTRSLDRASAGLGYRSLEGDRRAIRVRHSLLSCTIPGFKLGSHGLRCGCTALGMCVGHLAGSKAVEEPTAEEGHDTVLPVPDRDCLYRILWISRRAGDDTGQPRYGVAGGLYCDRPGEPGRTTA